MKKFMTLILFFLIILVLTNLQQIKHAARALPKDSHFIDTIQLSDHTATGNDSSLSRQWAVAGHDGAHIFWLENTDGDEGLDLFYRQLPLSNSTASLSDSDNTKGDVLWYEVRIAVATDKTPHLVWMEDSGTTEGFDLFYWNPDAGTLLLTDRALTEDSLGIPDGDVEILLDDNNQAHVMWRELGTDETTWLRFYWSQASGITQIIPGFDSFTVKGNKAHVFWEESDTGPIHYWNSDTQIDVIIPDSSGVEIGSKAMFVDKSDVVQILWSEASTTSCLLHWDSSGGATEVVVSDNACVGVWGIKMDTAGTVHAAGINFIGTGMYELYYWNDKMTDVMSVGEIGWENKDQKFYVSENGIAHLSWIKTSTQNDDLYHWDSDNQTITNLSESIGDNTTISEYLQSSRLSQTGELHLLWFENGPRYWVSDSDTVEDLNAKFALNNIEFAVPYLLDNGKAGVSGFVNPATHPFFWDRSSDTLYKPWEDEICNGWYSFVIDKLDRVNMAWASTGDFTTYHWDEDHGLTDLTATISSETECPYRSLLVDDLGRVYVTWVEESDVGGEGLDLFATWTDVTLGERTYLPFASNR